MQISTTSVAALGSGAVQFLRILGHIQSHAFPHS